MYFKLYLSLHFLDEGIYAMIGAAAVSGSVTKTVSPAIMVLEMTG
jgi:H+/Cl- antiporter ClcA